VCIRFDRFDTENDNILHDPMFMLCLPAKPKENGREEEMEACPPSMPTRGYSASGALSLRFTVD
jgi:hypothetical protein